MVLCLCSDIPSQKPDKREGLDIVVVAFDHRYPLSPHGSRVSTVIQRFLSVYSFKKKGLTRSLDHWLSLWWEKD